METVPPEDDRLTVKRELENQDGASAQKMYEVLDAVNRGQSQSPLSHFRPSFPVSHVYPHAGTHVASPNQTASWPQAPRRPTPGGDRDHDGRNSYSSSSSWRDRDERGGRERDHSERREDGERGREPASSGERKRSLGYQDGRGHVEGHGSGDRDRRERECEHLFPLDIFFFVPGPVIFWSSFLHFTSFTSIFVFPLEYRSHRILDAPLLLPTQRLLIHFPIQKRGKRPYVPHTCFIFNERNKNANPLTELTQLGF